MANSTHYRSFLWALLCLPLLAVVTHAERIVLAQDGRAAVSIVLPADAAPVLQTAAADLQHYIEAICGVELPIRNDGTETSGRGVYIGACTPTTAADLPASGLNPETYAIRVRDGNLFFTGRHATPTAFAVYSFIEDTLGVRWFAPGKLWEHVPESTPGELAVEQTDRVKIPDTSPRIWSGHAWDDDWRRWNLRNKTVPGEIIPRREFQNRVHLAFPVETYAESKPEVYPLINGKRFIPPQGMTHWRPCEGNPEVQGLVVDFARRWFAAHPRSDSFSVGMDDISHLCSCPLCRALDPRPDSYEKREFSDRHYKFVNAIARELAKTHPDRYVGTLIYNIARNLPETVEQLEPNVFGFITETSALWWQEGRREADHALTREWARRCNHLSRYDYYGMGCFTPRFYPHAVAEQIKFDKSLGLEGMYIEVYTFLPHTAPMIWMTAKLQWDHTPDPDVLLADFYSRMYGPAATLMGRYWDLLETSWNTPREGRVGWVHRRIRNQALAMSPEDVDQAFALLDAALAACETEPQRQRISIHRDALRYSSFAILAYALNQELTGLRIVDQASADRAVARLVRLGELASERRQMYAEVPTRDDLLGRNVRALTEDMAYMPIGNFPHLESGVFPALNRTLSWYIREAPEQVPALASRLEASLAGSVGDLARAWLWVTNTTPDSMLRNSDFELTAANREEPAREDWQTEGAPAGWNVWSSSPETRFSLAPDDGIDGSTAAAITGGRSATFIQNLQAAPGERYLCTLAIRQQGRPEVESRLLIRFRKASGAWHPRRDLEPQVQADGSNPDWQTVALLIEVPEDAGMMSIMPGVTGQQDGDRTLFDAVRLYRLPAEALAH